MSVDMSEFYGIFFEEAGELLAEMENLLLKMDIEAPDVEEMNAIFRAAHSIKGGAGTFGFTDMTDVTHVLETLLDRLRKGELLPTSEMVDTFLRAGDVLQGQLAGHRGDGSADPEMVTEVCATLNRLASGTDAPAQASPAPVAQVSAAPPAQAIAVVEPDAGSCQFQIGFSLPGSINASRAVLHNLRNAMNAIGILEETSAPASEDTVPAAFVWRVVTDSSEEDIWEAFAFVVDPTNLKIESVAVTVRPTPVEAAPTIPETAQSDGVDSEEDASFGFFDSATESRPAAPTEASDGGEFHKPLYDALVPPAVTETAVPVQPVQKAMPASADPVPTPASRGRRESDKPGAATAEATSIRVSVEKVDQLINLVGELVITQAMLAQTVMAATEDNENEELSAGMGLLERNTRDLQESVMSIRMMPISFVFSRFPRVVRDLAGKLGKQVELKTVGEGTELDKGLIEKIADPLTHLVRNSIDHGVETPEVRKAAGKPVSGSITLRAFHQGGSIVIEVGDDGAGLDREKLLAKGKERGLPVSDAMSDQDVWLLIFDAGFSTAKVVTDVSGRGVGMDVVRRNIQALGGSIEIDSALGVGTRIQIRLPLTLAILDGLSVRVGKQQYIIPLTNIIESLQPRMDEIKSVSGLGEVVQVRGEYLPIVRAQDAFNQGKSDPDMSKGIIVILESDGAKKALYVDELLGQNQVVIKSLESNYRKVPGVSGATIMGDGRVGLILDVGAVVRGTLSELKVAA